MGFADRRSVHMFLGEHPLARQVGEDPRHAYTIAVRHGFTDGSDVRRLDAKVEFLPHVVDELGGELARPDGEAQRRPALLAFEAGPCSKDSSGFGAVRRLSPVRGAECPDPHADDDERGPGDNGRLDRLVQQHGGQADRNDRREHELVGDA